MSRASDVLCAAANIADGRADLSHVAVILPTCNAGRHWNELVEGLRRQNIPAQQVLVIDSSSDDGTRELAEAEGFRVHCIQRRNFNHGGTRQQAISLVPWAEIVVYLTQDAILAGDDSIELLVKAFDDPEVAAAYGRQLPRPGAGPIEAHARLFNYPDESDVRDFDSRHRLGIKAAFLSNSFAAYRVQQLEQVGGFPSDAILSEDAIVAGRLLLGGWKTAYIADATAYHSHDFTTLQEFRRYFDIGVCHRREAWLRSSFGRAGSEGGRFVRSEMTFLRRHAPQQIPYALMRTVTKAIGYQLGLRGTSLSRSWSKRLSYHKGFWDSAAAETQWTPNKSTHA